MTLRKPVQSALVLAFAALLPMIAGAQIRMLPHFDPPPIVFKPPLEFHPTLPPPPPPPRVDLKNMEPVPCHRLITWTDAQGHTYTSIESCH